MIPDALVAGKEGNRRAMDTCCGVDGVDRGAAASVRGREATASNPLTEFRHPQIVRQESQRERTHVYIFIKVTHQEYLDSSSFPLPKERN